MTTRYHNHHIIPKHAGGSDDPENFVRLTIEEHAQAHRELYETYGRDEDKLAWQALSGQLTVDEIAWERQRVGASKGGKIGGPIAGKKCADENLGFIRKGTEQHREWGKMAVTAKAGIHSDNWDKAIGGRVGGIKCRDEKLGWHADPGLGSRGKIYVTKNGKEKKCYQEDVQKWLDDGWSIGISQKRSELSVETGKKCFENKIGWHADPGKGSRGTKWINKDGVRKKCKPEELEQKKNEGWNAGRGYWKKEK